MVKSTFTLLLINKKQIVFNVITLVCENIQVIRCFVKKNLNFRKQNLSEYKIRNVYYHFDL